MTKNDMKNLCDYLYIEINKKTKMKVDKLTYENQQPTF